jgi:hypothetical protein
MRNILVALVVALGFRIRGGLGERSGRKLPANKLRFGALFACCACAIRGWYLNYWLLNFISCYVAVMFAGWLYRKGIDDGKSGLNIGEWLFGFWEGLCLAWWR